MAAVSRSLSDVSLEDVACIVQTNLSTVTLGQPILPFDIISLIDDQLNRDIFNTPAGVNENLTRLDAIGTSLWNTCSQLIVVRGQFGVDLCALAKARALAFALINIAVPSKVIGWLRSLACSCIAAQTSIVTKQLKSAHKILSVSATRLQALQASELGLDATLHRSLATKYWLLRVRLAAQMQRFDIAEHLWSKISSPVLIKDRQSVLETSFWVGDKAILLDPPAAVQWLKVAYQTLKDLNNATEQNFKAYKDWALLISHSLGFDNVVSHNRITSRNMITPVAAITALHSLLTTTLPREWTDKCFLAYLVLISRSPERDQRWVYDTNHVIKSLEQRGYPSFGPTTAQAAVLCLWKLSALAIEKGDYRLAAGWLRICNDPKISANCNQDTRYRIARKALACYVEIGSLASARDILNYGLTQGPFDCKRVYLEYRLAMMEGQDLSDPPVPKKQACLLSCALAAQLQNKPEEFMSCLGQLVKCSHAGGIHHPGFSPAEHHMFLICLVLSELAKYRNDEFHLRVNEVLANALQYAREYSGYEGGDRQVWITQLQWFYQASYRVAVQLAHHQNVEVTLQALRYSHEFTLLYRRVAGIEGRLKVPRPHFFLINFVRLITYADGARFSSDQEKKRSYYTSLRAVFNTLSTLFGWVDGQEASTEASASIEENQYFLGAFFNFEATVQLGLWEELREICRNRHKFPKTRYYHHMLDMILQPGTPAAIQIKVLKRIVFDIVSFVTGGSSDTAYYLSKIPRYLYCMFLIATSSEPAGTELADGAVMTDFLLAEKVLDQIHTMAEREASKDSNDDGKFQVYQTETEHYFIGGKNPFPSLELEQVARLAFNRAADFYSTGEDEICFRWAHKAIDLARLVPGVAGETLVQELEERLELLD
ncbi:unnamed protein product [Penicillium olsonii]|uniref:Uncharacterized protein n=1 Tax=Penicillium olsonii TaxID=99116 RepID=A0A9W4MPE4_PENOL|nr:unnamed protein product [Penicillium olsonii]